MFKRLLSLTVIICFFLTTLGPLPRAHADTVLGLPAPGTMVSLSSAYEPVMIKGLTVHKDNPFLFDFIVDIGQDRMSGEPLKKEGEKLIKYFLASLAIPDRDRWVNLSPYEKNRMIPEALGQTDMGRDLLAQDYILKQITASLIYPEKDLGKKFWDKVYSKAQQTYGTTQIPVNTFNKVWIMADRAEVFEHNQTAFVVGQHLKVMLEEDYLALQKHNTGVIPAPPSSRARAVARAGIHSLGSQIVRSIILPELEKEVNTGKNFANLRQIFNSVILATWYRKNLKEALLNQVYSDKSKVKGINLNDPTIKQQIYEQYLKAYKKGVFNYIKEDVNAAGATMPRKYFSGGTLATEPNLAITTDPTTLEGVAAEGPEQLKRLTTAISPEGNPSAAMRSNPRNNVIRAVSFNDGEPSEELGIEENTKINIYSSVDNKEGVFFVFFDKDKNFLFYKDSDDPSATYSLDGRLISKIEILANPAMNSEPLSYGHRMEVGMGQTVFFRSDYGAFDVQFQNDGVVNVNDDNARPGTSPGRAYPGRVFEFSKGGRHLSDIYFEGSRLFVKNVSGKEFKTSAAMLSKQGFHGRNNLNPRLTSSRFGATVQSDEGSHANTQAGTGAVNLGKKYSLIKDIFDDFGENPVSRPWVTVTIRNPANTLITSTVRMQVTYISPIGEKIEGVGEDGEQVEVYRDRFLGAQADAAMKVVTPRDLKQLTLGGYQEIFPADGSGARTDVKYVRLVKGGRPNSNTLAFYDGNKKEVGEFYSFPAEAQVYVLGPLLIIDKDIDNGTGNNMRLIYVKERLPGKWAAVYLSYDQIEDVVSTGGNRFSVDIPYGNIRVAPGSVKLDNEGIHAKYYGEFWSGAIHINFAELFRSLFPNIDFRANPAMTTAQINKKTLERIALPIIKEEKILSVWSFEGFPRSFSDGRLVIGVGDEIGRDGLTPPERKIADVERALRDIGNTVIQEIPGLTFEVYRSQAVFMDDQMLRDIGGGKTPIVLSFKSNTENSSASAAMATRKDAAKIRPELRYFFTFRGAPKTGYPLEEVATVIKDIKGLSVALERRERVDEYAHHNFEPRAIGDRLLAHGQEERLSRSAGIARNLWEEYTYANPTEGRTFRQFISSELENITAKRKSPAIRQEALYYFMTVNRNNGYPLEEVAAVIKDIKGLSVALDSERRVEEYAYRIQPYMVGMRLESGREERLFRRAAIVRNLWKDYAYANPTKVRTFTQFISSELEDITAALTNGNTSVSGSTSAAMNTAQKPATASATVITKDQIKSLYTRPGEKILDPHAKLQGVVGETKNVVIAYYDIPEKLRGASYDGSYYVIYNKETGQVVDWQKKAIRQERLYLDNDWRQAPDVAKVDKSRDLLVWGSQQRGTVVSLLDGRVLAGDTDYSFQGEFVRVLHYRANGWHDAHLNSFRHSWPACEIDDVTVDQENYPLKYLGGQVFFEHDGEIFDLTGGQESLLDGSFSPRDIAESGNTITFTTSDGRGRRVRRTYEGGNGLVSEELASSKNKAATANNKKQDQVEGGIDLNTTNGMQWKVSRDGRGVEMNIDPAMIERVRREGVDSLSPVILRITPVTSIWPLIGIQAPVQ